MITPLEGIRILDLSRYLPGEFATMMLGDLGAEIIKVESPGIGDPGRKTKPLKNKESYLFLLLNRNKKSLTLNLKHPIGKEIFYKLCKMSDVIFENFRPGVTKRLEISYEIIKNINPDIIYCSLSGYGQTGPYKDKLGHDINYMGIGGVLSLTRANDGTPIIPGVQIADLMGANISVISILAALIEKLNKKEGQYIDVSMLDSLVSCLPVHAAIYFGEKMVPIGGKTRVTGGSPNYDIYQTKDGRYLTIGILEEKYWKELCKIFGMGENSDVFGTTEKKKNEIKSFLKDKFLKKTLKEWEEEFHGKEICFAPLKNLEEVFSDPNVIQRKMIEEYDHPEEGKIMQIGIPMKFLNSPVKIRLFPPALGEHNREIISSLGYSEEEIRNLEKDGVI